MKTGFEYYALQEETLAFVKSFAEKRPLYCLLGQQGIGRCLTEVDPRAIDLKAVQALRSPELLFGMDQPTVNVAGPFEFLRTYDGWVSLQFGWRDKAGDLEDSRFSLVTDSDEAL